MTTYDLYLESGPKKKKTMVHVFDLLGCVVTGPTTDEAIAATPDAIRAYLRFLRRHGESVDPEAKFELRIAEHITEGEWLGNGSPYIIYKADVEPVTAPEIEILLGRFHCLSDELATWSESIDDQQLDETPKEGGRPERAILLHVLGATGSYLSSALGSAKGFGAIHGAAERGEIPLSVALRKSDELVSTRVRATSKEERSAVRQLPAGPRTLRKALRRMLEHPWEHLMELSRRPGGPEL
jgi:predicted RNase H-like HicB family nuclease